MVSFCNPGVLGSISEFRRNYQSPILIGREPDATEKEVAKSEACASKLSNIVNKFILRRTNTLLSKHLPPKLTQIVVCNLTPMQRKIYKYVAENKLSASDDSSSSNNGDEKRMGDVLASITSLKKLCNHPQLLYAPAKSKYAEMGKKKGKECLDFSNFFPKGFSSSRRPGRHNSATACLRSAQDSNVDWSGKIQLLANMLKELRTKTDDRIVVVSNFTQTLDIIGCLCREQKYPYVRLDGSTSAKKRQKLVDRLNNPDDDILCFLLSSKAGGCGLNLVGANRLILFDPDWNPAVDKQAAARVWRDGQKKRTFVYRFLARGTIEEKIYQRQLSKEGLQGIVDAQNLESQFSMRDLKDLFSLKEGTLSDTHAKFKCSRCSADSIKRHVKQFATKTCDSKDDQTAKRHVVKRKKNTFVVPRMKASNEKEIEPNGAPQLGSPFEGDLGEWSHHLGSKTCDDAVLRAAGSGIVSFVFGCAIGSFDALKRAQEQMKRAEEVEEAQVKQEKAEEVEDSETAKCMVSI